MHLKQTGNSSGDEIANGIISISALRPVSIVTILTGLKDDMEIIQYNESQVGK